MYDALWTPSGTIVYTTIFKPNYVGVMSNSGKFIAHTIMLKPTYLSVSSDDFVYLADMIAGIYRSTDNGVNWYLVYELTEKKYCWEVIKVATDHCDEIWAREERDINFYLRVYVLDRKRPYDNVTWRDINVPTTYRKRINLRWSSLSFDGKMNIFLSDYDNEAVHVLSMNGQYHRQLLSSHHIWTKPSRLAFDKKRQLLYVGQAGCVVGVYALTYGDGGD